MSCPWTPWLQVYLHVDLTYYPAVRMYEMMGYELANDLEASFEVRITSETFVCRLFLQFYSCL